MTDIATQAAPQGAKGRDALEESEREANQNQPENFNEKAADKIVEILPVGGEEAPIKGLDPKP